MAMQRFSRAQRRANRERVIDWRTKNIPWIRAAVVGASAFEDVRDRKKCQGKASKTAVPCSCWMCGNPRKHQGERTLQEKKGALAGKERYED